MITDVEGRSSIGPVLRPQVLKPYWREYFRFCREAPELHQLVEAELVIEVENARGQARPFLDSQQAISRVLTKLGPTSRFHRQFSERFPDLKPNQVLGMHLYKLVAAAEDTWVYTPIQHPGHMFPHATYFIPTARR